MVEIVVDNAKKPTTQQNNNNKNNRSLCKYFHAIVMRQLKQVQQETYNNNNNVYSNNNYNNNNNIEYKQKTMKITSTMATNSSCLLAEDYDLCLGHEFPRSQRHTRHSKQNITEIFIIRMRKIHYNRKIVGIEARVELLAQ